VIREIFLLLISIWLIPQQDSDILKRYLQKIYLPQKEGLLSLRVCVEFPELKKLFPDLEVEFSWNAPQQRHIKINSSKLSQQERSQLSSALEKIFELVVPLDLEEINRRFKYRVEKKDNLTVITFVAKKSPSQKFIYWLNKDLALVRLKKIRTFCTEEKILEKIEEAQIELIQKKGKNLIHRLKTLIDRKIITTTVEYHELDGLIFPKKIHGGSKQKQWEIIFKDYRIKRR
jgi:hypothetical protein